MDTLQQIINDQNLTGNREDYEDLLNEIFHEPLPEITTSYGISYPPMMDQFQREYTEDALNRLQFDHIRFSLHWKYVEPADDVWQWEVFDERMAFAEKHNLSVFLTIEAKGPDWACSDDPNDNNDRSCVFQNISYFEDFVYQLATRYEGLIDKIQFGNEVLDESFFIGSAEDYALSANVTYDVFKEVSPDTSVVLSGFSAGVLRRYVAGRYNVSIPVYFQGKMLTGEELQEFLNSDWVKEQNNEVDFLLKNCKYDIMDIHLYYDVENWDEIYDIMVMKGAGKQVIVSEFGGPMVYNFGINDDPLIALLGPTETEVVYTDAYHAKRLYDYMIKLNTIGVEEVYYFKLAETLGEGSASFKSGLIDVPQLQVKPGFYVFQEINTARFY